MVCNNCRYQTPDGLNFCPNCGVPFNPQFARPYQTTQNFQQGFNTGHSEISPAEKSDKAVYTLGIIAFSIQIFWILFGFVGFGFISGFLIYESLLFLTSIAVVLFSFIFVKKQSYKTLLLILFLLLCIAEIYQHFLRRGFSPF